jgi:ribA/ribD-fused uncharacterized protein
MGEEERCLPSASSSEICFYRENSPYGELSNFYPLKQAIIYQGKAYATSEHLYQALKFLHPNASTIDLKYAELIRTSKTPNQSKILANQTEAGGYRWRIQLNSTIRKFKEKGAQPRSYWEDMKIEVMRSVLRLKFATDNHCRTVLLSTNKSKLIEDSPIDSFWGRGKDGKGRNHLGRLLEEIRSELQTSSLLQPQQTSRIEENRMIALSNRKRKPEGPLFPIFKRSYPISTK